MSEESLPPTPPLPTNLYFEVTNLILGDLKEQSLEEIWRSARYQEFRARLQSENPHPCCRTCGVGWSL